MGAAAALVSSAAILAACVQASADPQTPQTTATSRPSTRSSPTTTSAAPRVVVGLGDSVTAGNACSCTDFVTLYAAMLGARSGHTVRPVNLGVGGLTTATLAAQLSSVTTTAALSSADVVLVTIGANDLTPLINQWRHGGCGTTCVQKASTTMGAGLEAALAQVRAATTSHARILVTTYWNVFEDGDVADADFGPGFAGWSDAVTRSANAAIRAAAAADGDQVVDLYAPFEGRGDRNPTNLLADDGDHPNGAGNQLIAQTLLAASASVPPTTPTP
jgi:lysophospholipase L1-like esterase